MNYYLLLSLLAVTLKADANKKLVMVGGMNRDWDRLDSLEVVQDGDTLCDDGIIEPLPAGRYAPIASIIEVNGQERIMSCGGEDDGNHEECYQYDGKNWTAVSSMAFAVNSAPSATLGEKLYVFGGEQNMNEPNLRHIQIYHPMQDAWEVIPNALDEDTLFACALEIDDKIVLIGNYRQNKIFDGETLKYFPKSKFPRDTAGCAVVEIDGRTAIIAAGGINSRASGYSEYIYWNSENPSNSTWRMMKNNGFAKSHELNPAIAQVQGKIIMSGGSRYWEDVEELVIRSNDEDVLHRAKWQLSGKYLIQTRISSTNILVPKTLISNCQ